MLGHARVITCSDLETELLGLCASLSGQEPLDDDGVRGDKIILLGSSCAKALICRSLSRLVA